MLTNIRKPETFDLNYILNIDLKCFEDVWPTATWKSVFNDPTYGVLIGTFNGVPVGFIVWYLHRGDGIIIRLGVKPSFRNKNIGSQLLEAVEVILKQHSCKNVYFHVTESLCRPDNGIHLSAWLQDKKYKAQRLLRGEGYYCGLQEDKIVFCKSLTEVVQHGKKLSDE